MQTRVTLTLTTFPPNPLTAPGWRSFKNFCVDKNGKALPQTAWKAGAASKAESQSECVKRKTKCPAYEYGHKHGKDVGVSSAIHTQNCHAGSSLPKMKSLLQGNNSCSVQSANTRSGDPCGGTHKYLGVNCECQMQHTGNTCNRMHVDIIEGCCG